MSTKELVKLARKANLLNRLADTIERLERERDVLAKAYDGEKDASAQYRELAAAKSREKIDEFRRAEAAESELTTLRARVARLEEALKRISRPHDCGCVPCVGQCRSQESLEITNEGMRETARAALTEEQS